MKIGILLTDHVMDELKAKHGDMDDFYKYIFNKVDPTIKLEIFDVVEGIYPKDIEECQGYLITGSRFSVYDEVDWIKRLKRFVLELDQLKKPLIGVCFGHDLIDDIPWLKEDITLFTLLHSHKDQVSKLPDNATLIASTEKVPIAMFGVGDHIFSHQGHPEFKPEYVHDVATIRKEVLGDEVYLAAVENLKNKVPDNEMIAKCWVDFFRRKN